MNYVMKLASRGRPNIANKSAGSVALIIIIVLLVAATILSGFGVYMWQHHKVNYLQSHINSLNYQNRSLSSDVALLSGQLKNACQTPASSNPPASQCPTYSYTSQKGVMVLIYSPSTKAKVTSPVAVIGEVPGTWSTEAQFPVLLKDSGGKLITQAAAHLLSNWETTQLVPFSVELSYTNTLSGSGTIILQKDNPSGINQNNDSITIPVTLY